MLRRLIRAAALSMVLVAPAAAQCPNVNLPATGGGYYRVIANPVYDSTGAVVGGQVISQHTTERAAAARGLTEKMRSPGTVVVYTIASVTRVEGCFPTGTVDTVQVPGPPVVDTQYVMISADTLNGVDGERTAKLVKISPDTYRIEWNEVVPPTDTVTPPPTDTVTPPPTDTVVTPPPPPPPPPTTSTRLLATPERVATWQQMIADGHHLALLADANCKGNRYGDTGLWCAWWYMATGDQTAGRKAVTTWLATTGIETRPGGTNQIREEFIEKAVTYDWLCGRGAATASECATMRQRLDSWRESCKSVRVADGDQTIGCYFGRVAYAFATGDMADITAAGGLVATGLNRSTYRNTVAEYLTHMDGGALGESHAYDTGTAMLILMGVEVTKSATGVNHFPEFDPVDLGRYLSYGYTPGLEQPLQWWDDQDPQDVTGRLFRRSTLFGSVAGVTKDPIIMRTITDMFAKYGTTGYGSAEPWGRILIFYDPTVPIGPKAYGPWLANGHGMMYRRTPTTLGWLAAFEKTYEDHEYDHLFDVQLWRDNGWAIRHPIGYGGDDARVIASNGLSLAGLGSMGTRGMTWADTGATWIALAGKTQGGAYDGISYYDPPPPFVRYAGRTAVEAAVGQTSVIITRDTVDMDDPRTLPKFDRYRPATSTYPHQRWIQDADGKPWTIWHQQMQPTVTGQVVTWTAPNGDPVRVEFFADQPVQTATYAEAGNWSGTTRASELGWQTWSYTPARVLWSVVQVGPVLPVSRSGDTITVGGVAFTLTTAGVTGP